MTSLAPSTNAAEYATSLFSGSNIVIFVVRDEVVVGDSSMVRGLGTPVRDVEDEKMDWTRWR